MAEPIDPSEQGDFLKSVADYGYDAKDWKFAYERNDLNRGDGTYIAREIVTVTRISTGLVRTYQGGSGQSWSAAAAGEAKGKMFGDPPKR